MNIAVKMGERYREPGIGSHWLGKERYRVPARSVIALPVFTGDAVEVIDPQGLQKAHIAGFNQQGNVITAGLGLNENAKGELLALCLSSQVVANKTLSRKLSGLNISVAEASVAEVLNGETSPGQSICFVSEVDALCLIGAPGEDMLQGQNLVIDLPPTDLIVFIKRKNPHIQIDRQLPDPLADVREDFRISNSTARAYEVRAGEYIQVIDVQGRQCSDFQCFDLTKLDQGIERCLDATTTRALMGSAYPTPGLYSKFYDVDFEPMVEVVQDTCGRHDSFGLACTSKYYDEAGYPGHINCSDNFNRAMASYPVEPRKGWMAMNLFFNTFFDQAYQFGFDDPWSRPGDFVLMRALKDLLCVSSACPCDIDPANGWNPTDIHLRVYPEKNLFKRAIAFRKTTDEEAEMTKETGFHSRTSGLTRNFVEYNGYWLASNFINHGNVAEYWACRQGVIVTDLSPLRKYEVVGPDAEILLQTCVTRDVRKLSPGQVVYTAMCYESGGMIDDGTVFRLGKDNFRWIGGSDNSGLWLRQQALERGLKAWVKDSTDQLHNLQVQGPKSLDVMRKIIWTRPDQANIEELGWFRFSIARIGGEMGIPILVSRTGYTGERGYEVFCHPSQAEQVWDEIWQAGQEFDIKPLGLEALDMLRIEAGLIFAGYEFCDQTDPFEAGIGFTVPLKTKQDDFIGRQALEQRKANPQRILVGLDLAGEEPAANGDGVYIGRNQVGSITSGVISPILCKNIALCRINVEHSKVGNKLEVGKMDGHQKRIPCEVVVFAHYDPRKERVRGV